MRSVTQTVTKFLGLILFLAISTFSMALLTLASSLTDAEAVNVSGSMRMQSYRLAYDVQSGNDELEAHIYQFENSLYAQALKDLQRWYVPKEIQYKYYEIIERWHGLKRVLRGDNQQQYHLMVQGFVSNIDGFVLKLQRFSEQKIIILSWIGGLGLGAILFCAIYVVGYVRKQVANPMNSLLLASEQIQNRSFDIELNVDSDTEMGVLANTLNQTARDLGKMYRGLESAVNEKTARLQQANTSLEVLYKSSQELSVRKLDRETFQNILKHIVSIEGVMSVRLFINEADGKQVVLAEESLREERDLGGVHKEMLTIDGVELGVVHWTSSLPCPDPVLIDSFTHLLARAIHYSRAQRQSDQLIIMEERATIARELHDSLAQSLSYLKIQISLLKRLMAKECNKVNQEQSNSIVRDIEEGLSDAYTQLRELLTTFRLTLKEGSFGSALTEMISQLRERTAAEIKLENELSSISLDANQQVHMLQLIREATINAMKHSSAQTISISCMNDGDKVSIIIEDDGDGFDQDNVKANHYGMSIMRERATRLNGQLDVISTPNDGCRVALSFLNDKEMLSGNV